MPRYKPCCVTNCPNVKSYRHNPKLNPPNPYNYTYRMFKFPVERCPQRSRKWAEAIGKPEMEINSSTFICSDHFRKVDYILGSKRRLGDWAIPSLFLTIPAPAASTVARQQEEELKADVGQVQVKEVTTVVLKQGQSCLICSSDVHEDEEFRSPLKFNGDNSDSSSKLLDDQLWSTFILRDVLKLPKEDYQNLLETVGGSVHPSKWFAVCQICESTLLQILHVHENLRRLEKKLETLSGTVNNKLQESFVKEDKEQWEPTDDKQEDKAILNVRQEIRKSLGLLAPLIPKQEPLEEERIDDFDETWLPSPPPPLLLEPVKQENPLPSPTTCLESPSPKKDRRVPARPSVKKRQSIRKNNLKRKKASPSPSQAPTPRPRRIQIRTRKRNYTPVMCELCGQNSSSQCDLEKHMITHKLYDNCVDPAISTTHFICNLCPKCPSPALYPSRKLLSAHKRDHHVEELNLHIFKCSECPESFFWKNFFIEHLLRKHPLKFSEQYDHDKQKVFNCDECDYQTTFNIHLRRHSQTHHSEPLICQYCSSSSKNAITLQRHLRIYHPQQLPIQRKKSKPLFAGLLAPRSGVGTRFPCKNCDAVFPNKLELKLHLESIHKDLFTYQCDMCEKSYLSAPSLLTHKKIKHLESGEKAKCGWCGKVVNHKIYLSAHMKLCQKKPEAEEGSGPAVELT